MKTFVTMTVVVILGVLATTAVSLARLGTPLTLSPLSLDLPAEVEALPASDTAAPAPKENRPAAKPVAVMLEEEFDFGHLRNKTMDNEHIFKVRNDGNAPLEFTGSSVSCTKCTFVETPRTLIEPGETGEVVVRWNVDTFEDHFRQSAKVKTNDPDHDELRFVITGKVVRPLSVEPQKLVFSSVQVGEQAQAKVRLLAYFTDQLEIKEQSLADASTSEFFDIKTTAIPKADLGKEVKSGIEVTVTVKPGLPVGPIGQTLHLITNLAEEPELTIPVSGEIVGAVIVNHKDWDREKGYLQIGHVKQLEGAKRVLILIARGNDLEGLELKPPEINDPDAIKVNYGNVVAMKAGSVYRVPVTIEIPPGSPLVNHLGGSAESRPGTIVIPTNKPALGSIKLSVRFAVIADE
jgi:hypothetical protein